MHVSSRHFRLDQQHHTPSLDLARLAARTPRPPFRDNFEPQSVRPERPFADEESWTDALNQRLSISARSVMVGTIVLLFLTAPFWPLVQPGKNAIVPSFAHFDTARLPVAASDPPPGLTTGPALRNAATLEAATPRPVIREAFWTTFDGTPARPTRSAPPRRRVPPAASSPDLGSLWGAPEWAEPEADAWHALHLLQHLPAETPTTGRITSRFGPRRVPFGALAGRLQFHEGIDVAVPVGTPVVAPGPGIVVGLGFGHRFGRYVRIRHEAVGLETLLAHLSSVEPGIRYGAQVYRGQVVARSGNSGRSTGPHLHFEFRTVREQFPVDPTKVHTLYSQAFDQTADFPIASIQAQLVPYRIERPLLTDDRDLSRTIHDAY